MKVKLLTLAIAAALGATGHTYAGTIEFTGVKTPTSGVEKHSVLSSQFAFVDGVQTPISFNTILRSGESGYAKESDVFGTLTDSDGNTIVAEDGSIRISNSNDFSSLLKGSGESNNETLYMVSHFESRPGSMYLTKLKQDKKTGELEAKKTRPLDFSHVRGNWVPCAGSVTPWGSHLGSEEYEPNAAARDPHTGSIDDYYDAMAAYYGGDLLALNPYDYGYVVEVEVKNWNKVDISKHYAMGRVAIELAYVMPNEKTAYISDDGTNVGLYRFEADKTGDLSSGELFAAKWVQTSDAGVGTADIRWISLGKATDQEIRRYLDSGVTFDDIFSSDEPIGEGCSAGFTSINTTRGHECLKLKPGMAQAASRLETRRYAAMKGATTEWRKMEGITFNPDTRQMYLAMSEVARGMEDYSKNGNSKDKYDIGGGNHIRVRYNNCGAVYALDVDQDYVAYNMYGLISGTPTQAIDPESELPAYDPEGSLANNTCDVDGISNPDNITFMPGYNTLIIGEDTGSGHQNDIVWSYNLGSKELTRIQTTPYGSETTSPYFYPNLNGHAYLMSVIQHPYGESDADKLDELEDPQAAAAGYTGYIGPFPPMD